MSGLQPAPYSKDYEITDAMFGAFRFPGGARFFWTLFGWVTAAYALFNLIFLPIMCQDYVNFLVAALEIETAPERGLGTFWATFGRSMFTFFLMIVVATALIAIVRAAFFRGYFFGEIGGRFPFQFGRDEMRQGLAILGFYGLVLVALLGTVIVFLIPLALLMAAGGGQAIGLLVLSIIAMYLGFAVVFIWVGLRFCCAGALTALTGRTHVLAARHVSRNRFWALFGATLVAGLIGYVATYTASIAALFIAFSGLSAGDVLTMMSGTDPEAMLDILKNKMQTAQFSLTSLIAILLMSAGQAFFILIMSGPQAFFTKQWADAGGLRSSE
jgi:hypothetical protein